MICGEAELYVQRDGSIVRDTTLEPGLPHAPGGGLAVLVDVYGSWPDNAWLVSTRVADGVPFEITVFHWSGSRWTVAVPGRRTMEDDRTIIPWGTAGAAVIERTFPGDRTQLLGVGTRSGRKLRDVEAAAAFDKDTLVVATTHSEWLETDALRLWSVRSAAAVYATTPSENADAGADVVVRGIAAVKPGEAVAFGLRRSPTGGATSAYLARFDGRSLVLLTPPPTEDVTSYVEERTGVEWALSSKSDTPWRREAAGGWHAVPLPMPYKADELSLADSGAVWVRAYGPVVGDAASREVRSNVALFTTQALERALTFGAARGAE
jgi:hypothetical protein